MSVKTSRKLYKVENSREFISVEVFFSNCIERLPRLNCIGVNAYEATLSKWTFKYRQPSRETFVYLLSPISAVCNPHSHLALTWTCGLIVSTNSHLRDFLFYCFLARWMERGRRGKGYLLLTIHLLDNGNTHATKMPFWGKGTWWRRTQRESALVCERLTLECVCVCVCVCVWVCVCVCACVCVCVCLCEHVPASQEGRPWKRV